MTTTASKRRWPVYLLIGCAAVVVCLCAVAAAAAAYSYVRGQRGQAAEPTIEYILDASPRMDTASTGGDTRMGVARGVLAEIVRTADPRLTAGLRVFGTGALSQGCKDTDLVVPFAKANQGKIEGRLDGIESAPQSDSPVAEAMISAIKDMASTDGPHSIVVVTGGADSCTPEAGDLIRQEADRAGIELDVFVVGFEVPQDEIAAVMALVDLIPGATYLDAPDGAALRRVLTTIQTDVNHRADEALGASQPGPAARTSATACDHPYFPMRTGASWSYSATWGDMSWSVSDAGGSADSASATLVTAFSGGSVTSHFTCTTEGIVSYDFGNVSVADFGSVAAMDVVESSGVWLPAPELLTPGYSWTNNYTTSVSVSAVGVSADITSTTNESSTVVGTETVSVPAGTFQALRIDSTSVSTFSGLMVAMPPSTTNSTYWFAEGVGIVRYTNSSADSSGEGDLTTYSVP